MSHTRVELGFSVYDSKKEEYGEDFKLSFNLHEESLGTIFEKMEVMLIAMGFVLDGKELRLEDKEDIDYQAGTLLVEDFGHTVPHFGDTMATTFTTIPGGKS